MQKNFLSKLNIIAEIGQSHEGNISLAHSYIDAIYKAGVSTVKFQMHFASEESSAHDKFRTKVKYLFDKTRFDYWKRVEFSIDQWRELKKHAESLGLLFLVSPFSFKAVNILQKLNIQGWKIGSGELNNFPLIERIARTKKPIILSTGLSDYKEIDQTVNLIKNFHENIALMQCTSLYPCPKEMFGLNVIQELKKRYNNLKIGFSDHSGNLLTSLAAKALGADFVEVHVVFDKNISGFDTESSITISDLEVLSKNFNYLKKILVYKVNKNLINKSLIKNKILFEKSIILKKNMIPNQKILLKNLDFKKPRNGIPAKDFRKILGKKVNKKKRKGSFLLKNDILL
jgi:N,N'-diacetyllegionaminate synthase